MKKSLFVGCLVLLVAGGTQKLSSTAARAENLSQVAQLSKQSAKTPSQAQNQLKLLSTGTEPRRQLRLAPAENAKQTAQMTMKIDVEMSVAGQTQRLPAPPSIQTTVESNVTKVDANGDIHVNLSYLNSDVVADANTPPQLVNAMRSQMKKLSGMSSSAILDNQGNTKQVSFNLPQGLDPNTKQMMEQMMNSIKQLSLPIPAESVGVGAKWQFPNSVVVNGMALHQITTCELVELKDNVATLQVSIEQQAEPQKMTPPGLPAGTSVDLKSMNSQGNGQVMIALNQILPIRSNMSVHTNMEMAFKDAESQKEMLMGMNSVMEMMFQSK
ncbi:hypothetical protein [Allocoleopsis sp.]|uniref:hypothetical protein n=1 Tax=Allocoleopsis sp. TaxID=3088169 RepID=UPI002FD589CE